MCSAVQCSPVQSNLKFVFNLNNVSKSLSLHLNHTTRRVQVQGAAVMPNNNPVAVWFAKNILKSQFTELAKTKQQSIDSFHNRHLSLVAGQFAKPVPAQPRRSNLSTAATSKNTCIHCFKMFYPLQTKNPMPASLGFARATCTHAVLPPTPAHLPPSSLLLH